MKKTCLIMVLCCLTTSLFARSNVPSLVQVRKKIDTAVQSGSSVPLKDLLGKNKGDQKGPIAIKGIITADKNCLKTPAEKAQEDMDALYWAGQKSFSDELVTLVAQSNNKAVTRLRDKIMERHGGAKVPLIAFVQALAHEELQLTTIRNTLFTLMNDSSPRADGTVKALFDRHVLLERTLQQLLQNVNKILIG